MCHRHVKWANIVRKMAPIDLLPAELPQTFSLGKKKKKTQYLGHAKNEDHGIQSHPFVHGRWGKKCKRWQILFSRAPKSLWMVTEAMKLKDPCSLEEKLTNLDSIFKAETSPCQQKTLYSFDHTKDYNPLTMVFSSSHVQMWDLGHEQGWVLKNWCFQTVVLKKTLESPLDSKEIKPVNPKGNQAWIFIVRPDAEAEAPILWPPPAKSWVTGKDPNTGKDWRQKKGMTEDEMVG